MLFVQLMIDNSTASPMMPTDFVKHYYLTDRCKKEMITIDVQQGDVLTTKAEGTKKGH